MFTSWIGVQWRLNKWIIVWLLVAVAAGVVIGVTTVMNPKITAGNISSHLLDTNLARVIKPSASVGKLFAMRIFAFGLAFLLVLVVCLNRWTMLLSFIVAGYQGFSAVLNLYWIIAKFGVVGIVLLVIYAILLVGLAVLTICMIVFCMRVGACARGAGMRGAIDWPVLGRGTLMLGIAISAFALLEYLFFFVILSRIVFVV